MYESALNGHTVSEVKSEIARRTGYPVESIRLHGSRIHGGWRPDSDLDIVIVDADRAEEMDLVPLDFFGLHGEIRFVEDFELSWLRYGQSV